MGKLPGNAGKGSRVPPRATAASLHSGKCCAFPPISRKLHLGYRLHVAPRRISRPRRSRDRCSDPAPAFIRALITARQRPGNTLEDLPTFPAERRSPGVKVVPQLPLARPVRARRRELPGERSEPKREAFLPLLDTIETTASKKIVFLHLILV